MDMGERRHFLDFVCFVVFVDLCEGVDCLKRCWNIEKHRKIEKLSCFTFNNIKIPKWNTKPYLIAFFDTLIYAKPQLFKQNNGSNYIRYHFLIHKNYTKLHQITLDYIIKFLTPKTYSARIWSSAYDCRTDALICRAQDGSKATTMECASVWRKTCLPNVSVFGAIAKNWPGCNNNSSTNVWYLMLMVFRKLLWQVCLIST